MAPRDSGSLALGMLRRGEQALLSSPSGEQVRVPGLLCPKKSEEGGGARHALGRLGSPLWHFYAFRLPESGPFPGWTLECAGGRFRVLGSRENRLGTRLLCTKLLLEKVEGGDGA